MMLEPPDHQLLLALQQNGFFRLTEHFNQLFEQAELLAQNAGSNQLPAFEAFPSYIPSLSSAPISDPVLVIDVGGTSTKVGIRRSVDQQIEWNLLFEIDNDDIRDPQVRTSGLESFTSCLGQLVRNKIENLKLANSDLRVCAIVWSNAFESQPVDATGSITGLVVQKEMYKKGEWFNRDLKNGSDLGHIFINAFKKADINIAKFLVGNDTPLTMKAAQGANGGMVASTGLNGTIVKDLKSLGLGDSEASVICNAEMGGRFFISGELLSKFDLLSTGQSERTVEELVAGGFLPRIFVDHVSGLASQGLSELEPLARYLSSLPDKGYSFFRAEDLEGLISTPTKQAFIAAAPKLFSEQAVKSLSMLARQIFIRAARLAAAVAYGTVCGQVTNSGTLLVALDSSLCRASKLFYDSLVEQLATSPATKKACKIDVALLAPLDTEHGRISVPMQGAANALDCLL